MQVISFFSAKGGTGKTTFNMLFASYLKYVLGKRVIALRTRLVVCDVPVSALDVSIQAQILDLMMDLHDKLHLTYIFITHDLSVVRHISQEICVMYL